MRLIDADALKAVLRKHIDALRRNVEYGGALEAERAFWRKAGLENALDDITMADTIEAEPVRHGHCYVDSVGYERCSVCNDSEHNMRYFRFCPHCGAKMDGVG